MNLLIAPKNVQLRVRKIKSNDISKSQLSHLNNLGFVEGATCVVITDAKGSVITNIKGCRIGLGEDLAKRIRVDIDGGEECKIC